MSFHSRRYILHLRRRLIRVEAGKRGEVEIGCAVSLQRCKSCFNPGGHDRIASSGFLYLCFLFHTHLGHPRKLLGRSGCFCFCVLQRGACFSRGTVRDELRKETLQLARENLEKEQRSLELRNQCTIIRTTELAAAQDRLTDLERQKDDIMRSYSPAALLDKLQTSMGKLDEESEELHQKLLEKDIDLPTLGFFYWYHYNF
ncbi:vacuolar protein-sorting-associated protein 37 homolog 1-like isoform X3 [Miscanthus floridulus]|uniref:vacuolar protein-sorting-associated protein 37 homolog 1-like isoform X3 n=1 Tax=Miscanthus floridulus TaxID=154761 RepID=UPI00345932E6